MAKQSKQDKKPAEEQEPKEKTTIILRTTLLRKLKYISAVDDKFQGDILDEALSRYIADWEKKNREIQLKY